MHRVSRATLGTVAIGLVAVFIVVGLVGGGMLGSHSAAGSSSVGKNAAHLTPAGIAPAAGGAIVITSAFTGPTPFPAYETIPFLVNFTIGVVNASIDPADTTLFVNITNSNGPVTSTAMAVTTGQTAYNFTVDPTSLDCSVAACTGLPQVEYSIVVFIGEINTANATHAKASNTHPFFLITTPLVASLISPINGTQVPTGNVSVSVAYLGSWISGINLKIYSQAGILLFQHSMIELTPGVPVVANWIAGTAGVYPYQIVVQTTYVPNTHVFFGNITVSSKGGTVFYNVTKWSNQTVISGLSGPVAGTLLLVVGLIVGMIVALVLARAVMGKPAQAPPQPWESKPGAAAAPNTCSVCGKSFSTPEELAAHGKSEHGMQ